MRSRNPVRTAARTAGAAVVGATLAISLAACGDQSGNGSDETVKLSANAVLVKASQRTAQTDSFRANLTVTDPSAGGSTIRASGQIRLRPTLAFSATLDEISNDGRRLPVAGSQAILIGDTLYAKVRGMAGHFISNGKPWIKVDLRQASSRAGLDFNQLADTVQRVNPADLTKMFTASSDVRKVGQEKIDGTSTTHYTGSVTVREAMAKLDATTRQRVEKWNPDPNAKLHFDLWVDGDGLPRKLDTSGAKNGHRDAKITVTYHDYGKKVRVSAPPADQVGELSIPFGN